MRVYLMAFALVFGLVGTAAGAASQAGPQHRWRECPSGVATGEGAALCTTEDGGRTWRPIFYGGNYRAGWRWRRNLPTARAAAAAVVWNGEIVLLGGRAGLYGMRGFARESAPRPSSWAVASTRSAGTASAGV